MKEKDMEKDPVAYACDAHLREAGFHPNRGTCCKNARPLYRKAATKLKTRPEPSHDEP